MNTTILSFILTSIAGLSTIIGIIPIYFKEENKDYIISSALAFSSGVMLTISIVFLIPEASSLLSEIYNKVPAFLICAIFIIFGVLISSTLDKKIETKYSTSSLYKLGIISAIVLMLHNIPEGITTFISTTTNQKLGLKLSLAIALHNIPEGISIAVPIYFSTKSKLKAFIYTFIAGLSELLGAILAYIFLKELVTPFILGVILSLTAGIMIEISIDELLPASFKYKKNKATIYYFVLGIIIMYISELFFI